MTLDAGTFLGNNKTCVCADGAILSETVYTQKVYEGWHAHENTHLTLIVAGGTTEQRKKGASEAIPGNVLFYHSGEKHRNGNTQHPSKNINLEIEPRFYESYGLDEHAFAVSRLNHTSVALCLLKMYSASVHDPVNAGCSVHSLLLSLFSLKQEPDTSKGIPDWVPKLRDILHDHWQELPTLHELAKLINVHPVTISKFFPRYFHCTLGAYIRKLKVQKALALLQQPGRSLTDIAYTCGFFDQSHFIRTFKWETGFLPKAYKKL
jgi:AraC family transcriptional regulator